MSVGMLAPRPELAGALARVREELWRLREYASLGGCGANLSWIHNHAACTLNSLVLSKSCLALVLEGRKELLHSSPEPETVHAGGIVFFPAGYRISCANIPAEGGEYMALCLCFDEELLERVRLKISAEEQTGYAEKGDIPGTERLLVLLENFLRLLPEESDPTLPLMQQEQIVYQLWKLGISVFNEQHHLVTHIRSLVEKKPDHPWSAQELAASLHMTERTLRRQLEKLGTSTSELVRLSRLHKGLDLLMRKNVRVGEVAYACGYSSQSRFAERFREQFGIPPGEVLATRQTERLR